MRFADIVIDLAAVLNASRSVAAKHVALRARQLERYSRTSSVARDIGRSPGQPDTSGSEDATTPETATGSDVQPGAPQPAAASPARTAPSARIPVGAYERPNQDPQSTREYAQAAATPLATQQPPVKSPSLDLKPRHNDLAQRIIQQATLPVSGAPQRTDTASGPSTAPPKIIAEKLSADGVDGKEAEEEVPEGININVFQTARGSRILESLKNSPSRKADQGAAFQKRLEESHTTPFIDKSAGRTRIDSPIPGPTVTQRTSEAESQVAAPYASRASPAPPPAIAVAAASPHTSAVFAQAADATDAARPTYQLRESKVPASRISRLWNYGGLAAGMLGGALTESISRSFGGGSSQGSVMLSPANMERLVSKLSRMRGAALKMGQVMSFQDDKMLPGPIQQVLQRVQDRADYMPAWQRDHVLTANLGADWRNVFDAFEETPIAAASIGQVHRATLKRTGQQVAVKIQFPGVADSINSDLDNIGMLLTATKLLPKGLYLNKTLANSRTELAWECDYEREAACAERYREVLAANDEAGVFVVPAVFPEASGKHVLTMEYMSGVGVTRVDSFTQGQRDWIGTQILGLCLREIAEFRFMQTDPNWTNFLYNSATHKLELLDFGATREYPEEFVSLYIRLLHAASRGDRGGVKALSEELGYLTGLESRVMLDAHIQSVLTLAEPFLGSAPDVYDFQGQTITERVRALIPVMIRERLAPPPEETYSLHRKLSGAFLLCARLGSRVKCRELFEGALARSGFVPELSTKS